ncbi:hypothetical protein NC653_007692 [Populus alba x Populus x berolinensis]|uniref:Uncharacterized protein n=1 Tax=Populus alba x Populus x berolinensis TaxID=444605 RepID=A0AAD6WEP8_9ROSI|nr:hypothetical protein NC653_007692 [Populus alba x Populus x berolinensis]
MPTHIWSKICECRLKCLIYIPSPQTICFLVFVFVFIFWFSLIHFLAQLCMQISDFSIMFFDKIYWEDTPCCC